MKKIVLMMIALFTLNTLTYASFPITENGTTTEVVVDDADLAMEAPIMSDGPGWGIASLACAVLALMPVPGLLFLCIPAIVFGFIGLKKDLKGLAIAGLIIGFLELLLLFVAILFVAALFGVFS